MSRALSRGIQPEGIEQRDIKSTHQLHEVAHQHSEFMTSPVYVRTLTNTVATEYSVKVSQSLIALGPEGIAHTCRVLVQWDKNDNT